MNKEIVIINKYVNKSDKVAEFFSKKDISTLETENESELKQIVNEKIEKGYNSFIICGGDGTVNSFLNIYMKLNERMREKLQIGIMPCGRANDLARKLKIPFTIEEAYQVTKKNKTKQIDIIKVNSKYFITGGGFGLPAEVIQDLTRYSKRKSISNRLFKDLIYYIYVLKKVFLNYHGVKVESIDKKKIDKNFMFLSINNQDFIGKRFILTPGSINNDGVFEMCAIPKPNNYLEDFSIIQKVINSKHLKLKNTLFLKSKKLIIKTEGKEYFMADGELLDYSDKFDIKIIPSGIKVLC